MKLSVLASGASEHRPAFADMDQQRRKDGLHRRAVGKINAMITKWVDRTGFVMTSSSPPGKGCGLSLNLARVLVTILCKSR
jgi:hypothetical protein